MGAASSAKNSPTSPASSTTAQAVTPGQGQAVDIAGIQVGKITSVELEDGHAVVGMDIEPKYMKLIHPDATLLLRPKTNLNDMVVEVDPGSGKGHIEDGDNFPLAQTEPNTNLDAFLATLDADTRQYIQLLVAGGAQGIGGRGRQLSGAFRRFQPFAHYIAELNKAVAAAPRRARRRDPRLRPADHRTRPPRRRDRTLRHLLQGGARQLRQPAAGDPGVAGRVPADPDGRRSRPRQLQPLLDRRPPGADRPDPAGAGAGPGASRRTERFFDQTTAPIRDQIRPFTREIRPVAHPRQAGLGAAEEDGRPASATRSAAFNSFFNELAYKPKGSKAELPLLPALAQPRPQRRPSTSRTPAARSSAAW